MPTYLARLPTVNSAALHKPQSQPRMYCILPVNHNATHASNYLLGLMFIYLLNNLVFYCGLKNISLIIPECWRQETGHAGCLGGVLPRMILLI